MAAGTGRAKKSQTWAPWPERDRSERLSIADVDHAEHDSYMEWSGGDFNPERCDVPDINAFLTQVRHCPAATHRDLRTGIYFGINGHRRANCGENHPAGETGS